jgi:hypothetical protein
LIERLEHLFSPLSVPLRLLFTVVPVVTFVPKVKLLNHTHKYAVQEISFQLAIPETIIVVKKEVAVRVKTSYPPKSISILGTKVLDTCALPRGQDFKMCSFIDVLLEHSVVIDSLDEEQFLYQMIITLSLE